MVARRGLRRIVALLGSNRTSKTDREATPDDGTDTDTGSETETDEGASPSLYSCVECDMTYISVEMERCPRCGEVVSPTPSERDLGFTSADD